MSYAQSVIAYLVKELNTDLGRTPRIPLLPEPINSEHWGNISFVPFREVRTEGPWTIQRSANLVWIDQLLVTTAIGSKLRFSFQGKGLALGFDFGKLSADFRCRMDGGEATVIQLDRADWSPAEGIYHVEIVAEDLTTGMHEVEIEVIHGNGPGCQGTRFRLAFIGIIA